MFFHFYIIIVTINMIIVLSVTENMAYLSCRYQKNLYGLSDTRKIQFKRSCQVSATGRQIRRKQVENIKQKETFQRRLKRNIKQFFH